jgi:hypothetical protein
MRLITLILFITITLFSCKIENKKTEYKSGEWTIKECIQPIDAVLYSDYIILLENETDLYYKSDIRFQKPEKIYSSTKFTAINYFTNELDTAFENLINRDGISNLYVKKDTLYAFDVFKNSWLQWNNKWIQKSPFNNQFYFEFEKSYLKSRCKLIFEDSKYFVYSYNKGEFGTGVLFLNKENGKLSGHKMIRATSVFKDNNGYVVSGNTGYYKIMSQLIRIKNPDKLPTIPDYQIIYEKDTAKYDFRNQGNLAEYMFDEILRKLDDSTKIKLYAIQEKIQHFNERRDRDFSKRIILEMQVDSLFKLYENLKYLFDNSYWYIDDETLCYSTFNYQNKILHFIGDSNLYLAEFQNNRPIIYQDTIITNTIPLGLVISNWQINDKSLIVLNSGFMNDTCSTVNCLIIDNDNVKRYEFK